MKNKCTMLFNSYINNAPTDISIILELLDEYLRDKKIKDVQKYIDGAAKYPIILSNIFPELLDYFTRKYNINSVIYNNKIILYYV